MAILIAGHCHMERRCGWRRLSFVKPLRGMESKTTCAPGGSLRHEGQRERFLHRLRSTPGYDNATPLVLYEVLLPSGRHGMISTRWILPNLLRVIVMRSTPEALLGVARGASVFKRPWYDFNLLDTLHPARTIVMCSTPEALL